MKIIKVIKTPLISLLILISSQTFGQQVNFAGTWRFNKEKSDLSGCPAFNFPAQILLNMTVDSIYIGAIINAPDGKAMSLLPAKYPLNGRILEKALEGNSKRLSSCSFSNDKKSLFKKSKTLKANDTIRTVNEIWTLSPGGNVLLITLQEEDDHRKPYTVKGFFEKQ